jgi:hypothetical protein
MSLPSFIKFSKPTTAQIKHDVYLVVVAFITAFWASYQYQPNKFSKAAVIAGATAGIAAVITVVKSIVTTL